MPYLLSVIMPRFFTDCVDTFYMHKFTHYQVIFAKLRAPWERDNILVSVSILQKNSVQPKPKPKETLQLSQLKTLYSTSPVQEIDLPLVLSSISFAGIERQKLKEEYS